MEAGVWNPNWSEALRELGERGLLSGAEVEKATHSYDFLRRCETVLRRWENKSVTTLPADANEQSKLAKRLGYEDVTGFANEYVDVRERIHALYERHLKK
jgi:glutamine synthetase adenylyltransferase